MGWEYDGDEDAFNDFCNSHSSEQDIQEVNYHYSDNEPLESAIIQEILKAKHYVGSEFSISSFLKLEEILKEEILYLKQVTLFLDFDAQGDWIEESDYYDDKVKAENFPYYLKREELREIRSQLKGTLRLKQYNNLLERKNGRYGFVDKEYYCSNIDELSIFDIILGRYDFGLVQSSDILLKILAVATTYKVGEDCNYNFNTYNRNIYKELIIQDYKASKIQNIYNPFSCYLEESNFNDERVFNGIKGALFKLSEVYELFNSVKGAPEINWFELERKIDYEEQQLILKTTSFKIIIEFCTTLLNGIEQQLSFYIKSNGEYSKFCSFITDDNLVRKPRIRLDHYYNDIIEKRKEMRLKLNIDDLIFKGNSYLKNEKLNTSLILDDLNNNLFKNYEIPSFDLDYKSTSKASEIQLNSFDFKIENDIQGYGYEPGEKMLRSIQRFYDLKDKYWTPSDSEFGLSAKKNAEFTDKELLNIFINLVESNIPKVENCNYKVGDVFILYDSLVRVYKTDGEEYYLAEIETNSELSYFKYFGIDVKQYFENMFGYYLLSNRLVFRLLEELNKFVSRTQESIFLYGKSKKHLLKVNQNVEFLGKKVEVIFSEWRTKKDLFVLNINNSKDAEMISIDGYLSLGVRYLSMKVLRAEIKEYDDYFATKSLKELTARLNFFKKEVALIKQDNDRLFYPEVTIYVKGIKLKYRKDTWKDEFLIFEQYDSINERRQDSWVSNRRVNSEFKRKMLELFDPSCGDFAHQELTFSKDGSKMIFKLESEVLYFLESLVFHNYSTKKEGGLIPRNLKFYNLGEGVHINGKDFSIEKCSKGYYLITNDDISQFYFSSIYSLDIKQKAIDIIGYYKGGVFPYCENLVDLSLLVKELQN